MKPCYFYSCSFCDLGDVGSEITQTGDETEPKGPPKRGPARSRGSPISVPEQSGSCILEGNPVFFKQNKLTYVLLASVKNGVAKMTPVCRNVAPKTKHKRKDAVANERFKKNM